MNEPNLRPGDRVRLINPPGFEQIVLNWDGLRAGMEGVVTGGPFLITDYQRPRIWAWCRTYYNVYLSVGTQRLASLILEKLDDPPPESVDDDILEPSAVDGDGKQ